MREKTHPGEPTTGEPTTTEPAAEPEVPVSLEPEAEASAAATESPSAVGQEAGPPPALPSSFVPSPSPISSAPPAPQRAAGEPAASRRASTDVRAMKTFGLALLFYALAIVGATLAPAGARALLLQRGWPPHATLLLASVALAILLTKTLGLRTQRRAFARGLLPPGGARIGPEAAARLVEEIEPFRTIGGKRSFLVERILRVLSQYAANGEVAEASAANDADAEADAASVAASFSTVKVLIWAMPILGLIGTVIGLSSAVGAFSHAMSGADQLDTIKDSLREVTTGLAVAFDATFVALVASILAMLPMTWLQKGEDKLINDVDDYCVTNLLPRLGGKDAHAEQAKAAGPDAGEIREVLVEALAEMLAANARTMERTLAGAQDALVAQLSGFVASLREAAPALERAAVKLERATAEVGPSVDRLTGEIGRTSGAMASGVTRMTTVLERATDQMASGAERVMARLDERTAEVVPSLGRAVEQLDRSTAQATAGMERALTQLERTTAQVESRVAPGVERAADRIERATVELGASFERAVGQLEVSAAVADQAASASARVEDQLCRELGASRQLLSLLAAGLGGAGEAHGKPRHAGGGNGAGDRNDRNGANGQSAAREG